MEQITVTQLITLILGSSLLTTVFGKVFDYFTAARKTRAILLLGAIEQLVDKILRQGFRTHMQTLRLQEAQAQYEKYGDGYAKALVNDAMKMPLKQEAIND